MNSVIAAAVETFRQFPNVSDEEILRKLLAMGYERAIAARLVEFVSMAYCRVLLADSGVTFSDRFQRKLPNGKLSAERFLEQEPLWAEAVSFANEEKRIGAAGNAPLLVAGRGSEFDAVNQLANRGAKLDDIVLTPVVFQWQEYGPTPSGR